MTVNITDPANQLAWLEGILEASSQKKEKVGAMNRTHWRGLFKLWQFKKKKRDSENINIIHVTKEIANAEVACECSNSSSLNIRTVYILQ